MSELSKQALQVENNTQFPNNNSGFITPSRLRGFNTDMIDSTVNQAQYTADSASWNAQIDALENFSSSLDNNFVSETQFGAYTSSNDSKVNNLISTASIQESEINALIAFTGSISAVATGSLLVTASAVLNVITFTKGDASTFDVTVGADTTALNAFTASQESKDATLASVTASLQSETANLELFTSSANTRLTNLESFTSSQNTKNATLATYTGSNDTKWSTLGSQSGSWVTETESGSFLITASVNLNTITFTKGNNTQFSLTVNTGSGGGGDITALNAFTASQNTKNSTLATYTGSVDTKFATIANVTSSLNAYTASNDTKWSTLGSISGSWITESETGSFATLAGVNVFTNANSFTTFSVTGDNLTTQTWINISGSDNKTRGQIAWLYDTSPISNSGSQNDFTGFTISAVSGSKTGAIFDFKQVAEVNVSTVNGPSLHFEPVGTEAGNTNQIFFSYPGRAVFNTGAYATQSVVLSTKQVIFRSNLGGDYITFPVSGGVQNDTLVMDANRNMRFVSLNPLNAYTASNDTKWSNLGSQSGSFVTESETGSFARTNVTNTFTADQNFNNNVTIGQNLVVTGNLYVSGSEVIVSSSTLIVGDRIIEVNGNRAIGDAGIYAFDAIGNQTGSLIWNPTLNYWLAGLSGSETKVITAADTASMTVGTASLAGLAADVYVTVKNTTGAPISKGTIVRIIGATGDNPLIQTASWENDSNSANTLGWTYETIANDAFGKVITNGILLGVNTDPTLGYAAGQILYLSSSGQYTNQIPPAPYHEVRLGQVLRAQQNAGSVYVLIQNGYELSELHDVDITTGSLANNDLLAYNSSNSQWVNRTLTGVGGVLSSSFNAYTSSNDSKVDALIAATASYAISSSVAAVDAAQQSQINALIAVTASYATTGSNTFTGTQFIVSQSFSGSLISNLTDIYTDIPAVDKIVTISSASYAALVTGSLTDDNTLYIVSSSVEPPIDLGPLNAFTASQYVSNSFFATTGSNNFYGDQFIWDATGVTNAQFAVTDSPALLSISNKRLNPADGITIPGGQVQIILKNDGNGDYDTNIENVDNVGVRVQPAVATDAIMELAGYSLNVANTLTASLTEGYVWVGGDTGRTYEVATSSFGGGGTDISALNAFTASQEALNLTFATTGSNEFQASQVITGSLTLVSTDGVSFSSTITPDDTISRLTFSSGIKPFGVDIPDGEQISFLDAVDANWDTKLGQTDQLGLRIFTAGNVSGSRLTLDNYNLVVSGSARGRVDELSIASNTASIDLSKGNYFTLQLAASATTHITATNIQPGQTITLLLSTNTNSSVVLAPNILEPSGSFYTASASGSKDILSLVAFDSATLYAVSTKNMI